MHLHVNGCLFVLMYVHFPVNFFNEFEKNENDCLFNKMNVFSELYIMYFLVMTSKRYVYMGARHRQNGAWLLRFQLTILQLTGMLRHDVKPNLHNTVKFR